MIVAGELAAGTKLNEETIAEMLGVSRGPVREAFRALEASGLVRLEKNRGVFVRQVDIAEADAIYELRAVLDEFAGRRAAARAGPADIADLRLRVEQMEAAVATGSTDRYHAANLAFHDRLIELAGNPKLVELYGRLVTELALHRRALLDQAGILPLSLNEHRAIVDRIAEGEASAAGRLLHDHVMASRDRMHRAHEAATLFEPSPPASRNRRAR